MTGQVCLKLRPVLLNDLIEQGRFGAVTYVTAVQLDDRLADAHVALGSVSYYLDFEPRSAEAAYLRALELNPNNIDLLLAKQTLFKFKTQRC
jgi:hypothetical protein